MNKPTNKQNKQPKKRLVSDRKGTTYNLTEKIGQGGQGIVCKTNIPNVIIKIHEEKNEQKKKQWLNHIKWLMRQDFEGLKLARPLEIIDKPSNVNGYVMEMMSDFIPLEELINSSLKCLIENKTLENYRDKGGLKRRLILLKELAKTLSKLHARGLAYGDLSPSNIFVSESSENHQVWLIDCDNICFEERQQFTHTPKYAAPEIIRNESGINISTDCWSFAVIAMELLTNSHPFESGIAVENEAPEVGLRKASRGELPWIYDMNDSSNEWGGSGLPIEIVTTGKMKQLFEDCFSAGRRDISSRPSMRMWVDVLDFACLQMLNCFNNEPCMSFIYNKEKKCPFCDMIQESKNSLKFIHSDYYDDEEDKKMKWNKTGYYQLLNMGQKLTFHNAPAGVSFYHETSPACEIELKEDGLLIRPEPEFKVFLKSKINQIQIQQSELIERRSDKKIQYALHLLNKKNVSLSHSVWVFEW